MKMKEKEEHKLIDIYTLQDIEAEETLTWIQF